jgi:peptidoglycan/xylan/chitin deacetylase (PgdA/CDA1 family)
MSGTALSTARIRLKLVLKTLLAFPGWLIPGQRPMVRVLFYHRVNPYPFDQLGPVSRELTVTPPAFAWQLGHLAAKGYRVIGLAEFEQMIAGTRSLDSNSVLITFDDGYEDNLLFAAPLLRAARCPAVVFAVADLLGRCTADVWPDADPPKLGKFLTADQLRALEADGIEIASHTVTHPLLTHLPPDELDHELSASRARLEAIVGHPVTALAYPRGDFDERVVSAARAAGYSTAFTTETGAIVKGFRPLVLRRTEVSASDSRFVFRMKLAGRLDWLAFKDSAPARRFLAATNRLLLPLMRARA